MIGEVGINGELGKNGCLIKREFGIIGNLGKMQ